MSHPRKTEELLQLIDAILENHAKTNHLLRMDLERLRDQFEQAAIEQRWLDVAIDGLKIAQFIKFLLDNLPPPSC